MSHMFVKTARGGFDVRSLDETVRDVLVRFVGKEHAEIELFFQRKDIETAGWTSAKVSIVADLGDMFVTEGDGNVVYMIAKSVIQNY